VNIDNQIDELFREADSRHLERPSGRAWSRLEDRLDARKQGRERERSRVRQLFTRQVLVAAAFVGIVLLCGTMAVIHWLPQNQQVADKLVHYAPQTAANTTENATATTENNSENGQKNEATQNNIPATHDNRLLAKAEKNEMPTITATLNPAVKSDATLEKEQPRAEKKEVIAVLPPQTVTPNPKVTAAASQPIAAADIETAPYKDGNRNGIDDSYEKTAKSAVKATTAAPTATKKAAKAADKTGFVPRFESATNMTNAPGQLAKIMNINDLAWLNGDWHDNVTPTKSQEKWEREGQFTLVGTGYAVGTKTDTTRLETLKIQQEGNSVALYMPIDFTQKPQRYQLIESEPNYWLFENTTLTFPQQIALTRNDRNTFEWTMQNNTPINTPKAEQLSYLRTRNKIMQVRTTRTMQKVLK
jgi:hypothetical protein